MSASRLDELCINTIRFLAVDAVQNTGNGHPGTPMGAAPMAYTLWDRFLKHNPSDPAWPDRDRFVLSPGHASMLLYALLHLTGYDLPLDEIKRFRKWGSKTPGHPEYGLTPGVEVTTGPLGQGFANGVGMAIAERWLASHYNRPGHEIIDHYIYGIVSDGDLQEGVASEAASLAGTLGLGKVIYLYDDNDISIEGNTDIAFTENVAARFEAYGWHVVDSVNGMDTESVDAAIRLAQSETNRPSIVICKTTIGFGSPNKANTGGVHGEALGEDEVTLTKENLGWNFPEPFAIPDEALEHLRHAVDGGKEKQSIWVTAMESYGREYPEVAEALQIALDGRLPDGWDKELEGLFNPGDAPVATRTASGQVMNAIAKRVHNFMGGSADLAPSTRTILGDGGHFSDLEASGHNMHFGVREHGMGAVANGMAVHGGPIPYTATFLTFSDYMRPAMRLGALMEIRVIYVFTHDSVGLGEDGPTHQPIEHLISLRAMPNMVLIRPADATETVEAWKAAIQRTDGPTTLVFSRQNLPILDRNELSTAEGVHKGAYTLWEASPSPDVILIGTGSELHIALDAAKQLKDSGIASRVVSMPSWELFDVQTEEYRESVLPSSVEARVSIEAGTPMGWERYVGTKGSAIGVPHFGASASAEVLYEEFGLTAQRVIDEVNGIIR